jgi:hypothetical protein
MKLDNLIACVDVRAPLHFGGLHTATMIIALEPRTIKMLVETGA